MPPTSWYWRTSAAYATAVSSLGVVPGSGYFLDGDMALSVIVAANTSAVAITPPTNWTVLGSDAVGTMSMMVAGNESWVVADDGIGWGISGLTAGADSDAICHTWRLRGATGMAFSAANIEYVADNESTWGAAVDPSYTMRFQFMLGVGAWTDNMYWPDAATNTNTSLSHYQRVGWYPTVADQATGLDLLFNAPPNSANWGFHDVSGVAPYGTHIWKVGVGAS